MQVWGIALQYINQAKLYTALVKMCAVVLYDVSWCLYMFIWILIWCYCMLLYVIVCYCFPLCPRPSGCTEVAQVLTTQHHQFAFQRHQGPSKKFRTVTSILQCLELQETWATCKIYMSCMSVFACAIAYRFGIMQALTHTHTYNIYVRAREIFCHTNIYACINLCHY